LTKHPQSVFCRSLSFSLYFSTFSTFSLSYTLP
jgi:hypothetical protein